MGICKTCGNFYSRWIEHLNKYHNPNNSFEVKNKQKLAKLGKKKSLKMREKLSKTRKEMFRIGKLNAPMLNKHHTEKTKEKLKLARLGKPNLKERGISKNSGNKNPRYGIQSEFMKEIWKNKNEKEREELIKKISKGLSNKPTVLEQKLIDFIHSHNIPYKYVGNGSFLIGFKNPDFINCNGEKVCVEVRSKKVCEVWDKISPKEYEKQKIEHYAKYGWKCIVIFDDKFDEGVRKLRGD